MKSKQPLYSALGWITWTIGKRVIKRKLTGAGKPRRGRKLLLGLIVVGGATAGAYAVASSSSSDA